MAVAAAATVIISTTTIISIFAINYKTRLLSLKYKKATITAKAL